VTGKPEVISSPVGLLATNALVLGDLATSGWSAKVGRARNLCSKKTALSSGFNPL